MTPEEIAWWWCCQPENTRNSLIAVLALRTSFPEGTVKTAFDTIMGLYGYEVDSPQYNLWVTTFQVFFAEIEIDGVFIDGVGFDVTFWDAMTTFVLLTGTACDDPCYILKFALDHI